ncbi:hypothetical protein [Corynebacterium halotolerans]|nr:hypothetical protein [Corynebacterium halotolerans]
MSDEDASSRSESPRQDEGSRSHGDQSASAPDETAHAPEQSEGNHLQRLDRDFQRARQGHEDAESEVLDAEPVTRGELRHLFAEFWSGPTPSPQTLDDFKQVDPSFAERAFRMSEESVAASNYEKRRLVDGDVSAVHRGQWMSFVLTVVFVAAALISYLLSENVALSAAFLAPPAFQYLGKLIRTVRNEERDQIE